MCKQIRNTYYCKEIFLVKHKSKHNCESAIFYNLTSEVVYSGCQFKYFYNTTVTPSVLDGGSHILLANMLSSKRLACSNNFHMAHPVPSYPYVLVNRSLLCNCHLESGLTYVLKSLGSCSNKDRFTMYFSINSAFNHYMHNFGFSSQNESSTGLLTYEPVFDIYLNKSLPFRPLINDSAPILPLNPPDTLLKLFQSLKNSSPDSTNSPFFPMVRHASDVKPAKGSFLTSTIAHVVYLTTSCVVCVYGSSPNISFLQTQKIRTLVTAMTLQRLPISEAMSAFEIPNTKEAKLICQDPWVSIAVTTMTIIVVVYLYKACNRMTFFKGYLYDNVCTMYLFLSHDCYHVPLKLRELNGSLHNFTLNGQIKPEICNYSSMPCGTP